MMIAKTTNIACVLIALLLVPWHANSQTTVFGLFQKDKKLADKYFEEGDFKSALKLYNGYLKGRKPDYNIYLRIAQCNYEIKEYKEAIIAYEQYSKNSELPSNDLLNYAEASAATSNYKKAKELYKKYLIKVPGNELVSKKIWRLDNKHYLYEDSSHYALRTAGLNTPSGELCAVPYKNGVVFMSNRKVTSSIETNNSSATSSFYRLYFSKIVRDSILTSDNPFQFEKALHFGKSFDSKFNTGPVAFYNKEKKIAFIATSSGINAEGKRTLGLHFAESTNGKWEVTSSFSYNSDQYSIHDVTIDQTGKVLFFSSDMKGGLGGKDIYKSEWINGRWSKPINLGESINTSKDESFPFLYRNETLYFSSNGLAGLGELDIFKSLIKPNGFDDPQNVGYPLNTSYDDFGIVLDSIGTHGFLTSNRKNGGYDDDLYEFDMDLQTYPLTIKGILKYKEHAWSDSTNLKVLSNGKINLIDNLKNGKVYETVSDVSGNFKLVIPYFSKYYIQVIGETGDEHKVSLEILKYRKELSLYEIVIVKDFITKADDATKK
jgi:tetratricopeptide (TPR) repeat protein